MGIRKCGRAYSSPEKIQFVADFSRSKNKRIAKLGERLMEDLTPFERKVAKGEAAKPRNLRRPRVEEKMDGFRGTFMKDGETFHYSANVEVTPEDMAKIFRDFDAIIDAVNREMGFDVFDGRDPRGL